MKRGAAAGGDVRGGRVPRPSGPDHPGDHRRYALIALGLAAWLAFLIVTVALLLLAGILGFIGFTLVKKIRPPERAIASTKKTIAAVKGSVRP